MRKSEANNLVATAPVIDSIAPLKPKQVLTRAATLWYLNCPVDLRDLILRTSRGRRKESKCCSPIKTARDPLGSNPSHP